MLEKAGKNNLLEEACNYHDDDVPWYYFIPAVLLIVFLFVGPMFP